MTRLKVNICIILWQPSFSLYRSVTGGQGVEDPCLRCRGCVCDARGWSNSNAGDTESSDSLVEQQFLGIQWYGDIAFVM